MRPIPRLNGKTRYQSHSALIGRERIRIQHAKPRFVSCGRRMASAQFPRAQRVWANAFLQCWENIANQTPTIAAVAPQFLVTSLHLVLEHLSVFHHEPDSSQFFDVLQRVARDRDDIRIRARRHYANLSDHVEHLRRA